MADFKNFNEYFQEDENMKKLFGEEKSEPPVKNYEEIPESQNMIIHKGKTKNTCFTLLKYTITLCTTIENMELKLKKHKRTNPIYQGE